MTNQNNNRTLKKKEFDEWKEDHFNTLVKDVSYLRGKVKVLVPLTIGIMGLIATILVLLVTL